eukprot:4601431-Alexandrium_andersonii.AAC.1
MRVAQGQSIPWITIERLGRHLNTAESRMPLGGYIYRLTRSANLESALQIGIRAPQDSEDNWRARTSPSR